MFMFLIIFTCSVGDIDSENRIRLVIRILSILFAQLQSVSALNTPLELYGYAIGFEVSYPRLFGQWVILTSHTAHVLDQNARWNFS